MDKTKLKDFAIYSREKLIEDAKTRAGLVGITEGGIGSLHPNSTQDLYLFDIGSREPYKISGQDIIKYKSLVEELRIREKSSNYKTAYETLIEEVAYTWFNRIIAIRFLEINGYLPDNIRILSSDKLGVKEPDILSQYEYSSLNIDSEEKVEYQRLRFGSSLDTEELFRKLFIKTCNDLNKYLPDLFEKTDDYAELLLRISYNDTEGVVRKLLDEIPENYFDISENSDGESGQVEIIGWLYQYYNTDRRDQVINVTSRKIVEKKDIGAATQLFTTDWVVRYMVDNSLGKYWIERNPNSKLRGKLEYLMPGELETVNEKISPEDIKFLDNAMGSGHCLVYAFDIFMEIYESMGYHPREAARLIIEKNLYGLEIDKRAYQLAYFAIMVKARKYNRSIFSKNINLNLKVFKDSTSINGEHLQYFGINMEKSRRQQALEQVKYLITEFENAEELGSIIKLEDIDFGLIAEFIDEYDENTLVLETINIQNTQNYLVELWNIVKILKAKFDIVVTNPPYLNRMSGTLKKYLNNNYKDYKIDLFSVFVYNNIHMTKPKGYSAYMTPNVWMFLASYEKLRRYLIEQKRLDSLIQMAKGAFYKEATVDVMTFVIKNELSNKFGQYIRLEDFNGDMEVQKIKTLEAIENPDCGYYFQTNQNNFERIPGSPIAYWASEGVLKAFENGKSMNKLIEPKVGLQTADNDRFLRLWWEVDFNKINFNSDSIEDSVISKSKWFPYNKGGMRRQWYGNYDYVVNWENDGYEIRNFKDDKGKVRSRPQNTNFYFKESITWNLITSGGFSIRYRESGSIHDVSGMSAFSNDHNELMYLLGLTSTKLSDHIFKMLNPTINLQVGDFNNFPVLKRSEDTVINLVKDNLEIAKEEWNSYEEAWSFKTHPLIKKSNIKLKDNFGDYKHHREEMILKMQKNEEELNQMFIDLYKLNDVLEPDVDKKNITLKNANKMEDIKSLISYGVGCIFGRYSLDKEGLVYAGGEFHMGNYKKFKPVEDNIVLISEYDFVSGDISDKFIEFLKTAFGEENLEENLEFIGESLGGKGTPREILRRYFIRDFFKDHVKMYKKRPIYWLYDSGKENGFKALVYMHRYNMDTTGKIRTEYLHKVQDNYETKIENNKHLMEIYESSREKVKYENENIDLEKKLKEIRDYDKSIAVLSDMRIDIDLDDGVKVNHKKIQTDKKGKNLEILAKI